MSSVVEAKIENGRGAPPSSGTKITAHNSTCDWPSSVVYTVLSYPTVIGSVKLHSTCQSVSHTAVAISLTALWFHIFVNDNLSTFSDHRDWLYTTTIGQIGEEILIWYVFTNPVLVDGDSVTASHISLVELQGLSTHTHIVIRGPWIWDMNHYHTYIDMQTDLPAVPSSVVIVRVNDRGAPPDGGSNMTAHSSTCPSPSDVVYTVISYPTEMETEKVVIRR